MVNKGIDQVQCRFGKVCDNTVNITNKLLSVDLGIINILHLDDHLLFAKALSNRILKKFLNAIFKNIQNGDQALDYVLNCIEKNDNLDLIITDIAHLGLNGLDFSEAVRRIENKATKDIPILFITLHTDITFKSRAEKISLVKFLPKYATEEEINLAIQNLI